MVGVVQSGRFGSAAFTPTDVAGLAFWLDSSDAASFTYSSSTLVSQWNDKSGNARHAVQATPGNQPNRNGTQNGLATVAFTRSSNNYLKTASSFTLTPPATIYVVAKSALGSGNQGNIFDGWSSASNRWAVGNQVGGDPFLAYDSVGERITTATWGTTNYHQVTVPFKNSSSTIYVDGASQALGVAMTGSLVDFGGANVGRYDGGAGYWDGFIAEVLMYSGDHSSGTRGSVEAYLKTKWGTP